MTSARHLALFAALVLYAAIALAPLLWMLSTSLKAPSDIFRLPPEWIPRLTDPVFANYETVWSRRDFVTYFRNSLIISTLAAMGQVFTCALAGYAFARLPLRGKDTLFAIVLGTAFIPTEVTIIPEFLIMRQVGWIDTWLPLIVPSFLVGAFGTFLLKEYFAALPDVYAQAAAMDGASVFQTFRDIYLPLASPALISVFVIAFISQLGRVAAPALVSQYAGIVHRAPWPDGVLFRIRGCVARIDGSLGDFGFATRYHLCRDPALRRCGVCGRGDQMTPNPVSHRLASGHPATILVMRPKAVILDPGYRKAPEPSQIALARRLGEARLERPLTPLPLPDVMLASPERVDHPRFGPIEICSARAKAALAGGPGQAGLYCLRQMSAELDNNALIANATYFLFNMPDLDAPWNAYGDPYGLVLSGGSSTIRPNCRAPAF